MDTSSAVIAIIGTLASIVAITAGTIQIIKFVEERREKKRIASAQPTSRPPASQLLGTAVTPLPPVKPPAPRQNLPVPTTSLIGREQELAALHSLLARTSVRLVTLTGPGGTGKTRLAIQLGMELLDTFEDGVYWVALAPVSDPALVAPSIARALDLHEMMGQPLLDTLKAFLKDKHLLLLLDNFEHVVSAAPLITDLLAAAPLLKVVVTSREILRLNGEHEFPVPPLIGPDLQQLPPLQELSNSPAIQLFIERAGAVKPGFALTAENARAIAEICAQLDGLPLAIELAAARINVLTPAMILSQLQVSALKLLKGGARDLPARQQTLLSAMAWSYNLLKAKEQRLFRRFSVFAGGATLDAVTLVCAGDGVEAEEILDLLSSLIDKSLLLQREQRGESRLLMLRIIREYALEQLTGSGEENAIRRDHAEYLLKLAETAERELVGPSQKQWFDRLDREHNNLQAALQWTSEQGDLETTAQLSGALWRFWLWRGYLSEGRRWLDTVLTSDSGVSASARVKALAAAGFLASNQGDYPRAEELGKDGLTLARQLGDKPAVALALFGLANTRFRRGDSGAARSMYEESIAIYDELGNRWGTANSMVFLADIDWWQGDYAAAYAQYTAALAIFRELENTWGIAYALNGLSFVETNRGELESARAHIEESLALMRSLEDRRGIMRGLGGLGHNQLIQGDYNSARATWAESLVRAKELGDKWSIATCFEGLAGAFIGQGQLLRGVRLFGAAEALRDLLGAPILPAFRGRYERDVAAARMRLDQATFVKVWAEGRALTLEQAIELAMGDEQ